MTGPENYREADLLGDQAEKLFAAYVQAHDEDGNSPDVNLIRRQAEHCRDMGLLRATLALAAATALPPSPPDYSPSLDEIAWAEVAGTQPPTAASDDAEVDA